MSAIDLRRRFVSARRGSFAIGSILALATLARFSIANPSQGKSNAIEHAVSGAQPAVVKLYGRGIGREHGYGTGFIVSSDGQIVTTQSLLVAGRSIRAVTSDGREYDADLVRHDDSRNLALLKIDGKDLPHISLISSDALQPGDPVIALGNWFKVAEGEEPVSVSRGILSLRTQLDARRLTQDFDYAGPVLIIDAITANPGAPGGPLLDIDGRCVGVIGLIVEASATNTRLNYAVPAEEVVSFLSGQSAPASQGAIEGAVEGEPFLGIRLSKLGFRQVSAYVERVVPGSPAAEAGVKKDDLILTVDGRHIADAESFEEVVNELKPGQSIEIVLKRGEKLIRAPVTVGVKK
ncbi:MAG TPA: trypsin-like peptidase domain-containing protein [Phycisphaerae bacterium]|nr:trypsin-like peptidase domain-containing protein [Phycisphaerae bacterium]